MLLRILKSIKYISTAELRAFFNYKDKRRMKKNRTILWAVCLLLACANGWAEKKTVYVSYILHGNMNYDRYIRPTIWEEFPKIYDGLLDFMDEYPDFKGQLQFSGQTLGSLLQTAPDVLLHARTIHERGQLNFTGTFYSEPVNVNMDGETNYRCAWLGTKLVEQFLGEKTDGFYLQERAYHPQLPWILNHSDVSWTPIITNDDSWFPFKLKGMDGSVSVCVPITRSDIIKRALQAPDNSLLTIEEDYEIPQSFTNTYFKVQAFNEQNDTIRMEWITVKDYICRFGVKPEKYIDHTAKAKNRENGTYSRWTADPLDIITQDYTNRAMRDFRASRIFNALLTYCYQQNFDQPLEQWKGTLPEDPLVWDIEQAALYPNVEPDFLRHNGEVTLFSKAEHLLLWGVNSDAKGWFPLYEKRRERQNSFRGCSYLSQDVIHQGMDWLASKIKMKGYDRYYMLVNMQTAREKQLSITTARPVELYDVQTGKRLEQRCHRSGDASSFVVDFVAAMPSYSYQVIGARETDSFETPEWQLGYRITLGNQMLTVADGFLRYDAGDASYDIALEEFQVKALAEMAQGQGDDEWRPTKAHGEPRIRVCGNMLYPQLCIDWQVDWLIHLHALFTLEPGQLVLDADLEFPHPTLISRNVDEEYRPSFNPEGLDLIIRSGRECRVGYDIPFGIAEYDQSDMNYFCALSSCFMQNEDGGILVSPMTGEQAFGVNTDEGQMKVYMGSSTISGPIRNVGLWFNTPTDVHHEQHWYAEPFHGSYHHRVLLVPFKGKWQDAHLPRLMQQNSTPVYVRECLGKGKGKLPVQRSFVDYDDPNLDITMMDVVDGRLMFRLNEREGRPTSSVLTVDGHPFRNEVNPFGIVEE